MLAAGESFGLFAGAARQEAEPSVSLGDATACADRLLMVAAACIRR